MQLLRSGLKVIKNEKIIIPGDIESLKQLIFQMCSKCMELFRWKTTVTRMIKWSLYETILFMLNMTIIIEHLIK